MFLTCDIGNIFLTISKYLEKKYTKQKTIYELWAWLRIYPWYVWSFCAIPHDLRSSLCLWNFLSAHHICSEREIKTEKFSGRARKRSGRHLTRYLIYKYVKIFSFDIFPNSLGDFMFSSLLVVVENIFISLLNSFFFFHEHLFVYLAGVVWKEEREFEIFESFLCLHMYLVSLRRDHNSKK